MCEWKRIEREEFNQLVGEKIYNIIEYNLDGILAMSTLMGLQHELCVYYIDECDSYDKIEEWESENRCYFRIHSTQLNKHICVVIASDIKNGDIREFIVNLNNSDESTEFKTFEDFKTKNVHDVTGKQWKTNDINKISELMNLVYLLIDKI